MAVASVATDAATEIFVPGSEEEAIAAFGDGAEVVVVGGGTIVVPEMTYRRLRPAKALMLGRAGLHGHREGRLARHDRRDDARAGARRAWRRHSGRAPRTSRTSRSARRRPSAATSARARATRRRAATSRARSSRSARRHARPRAARSRTSRSRTSFRSGADRLLLSVELRRAGGRRVRRPRSAAHARLHGARRLRSARLPTGRSASRRREPARTDSDFRRPKRGDADAALNDVTPHDDALASAWYRTKVLPVLVRRVLAELKESA